MEVKPATKDVRWKNPVEISSADTTLHRCTQNNTLQNKLVVKEMELNSQIVPRLTTFKQLELSDSTSSCASHNRIADESFEDRRVEEERK